MAFLRKKEIKGHEYWYIVENRWVDGKPRQKVLKYLGKRENFDLEKVVRFLDEYNRKKKEQRKNKKDKK